MDLSRSKTPIGPQLHIARHCRTTYQNGPDHDFGNGRLVHLGSAALRDDPCQRLAAEEIVATDRGH